MPRKPATASTDNYTKPALRQRLKQKIQQGSKGGKAGQWSARKAQLLKHDYEAEGGGYKAKKTAQQKNLSNWTKENWQTSDQKPAIRGKKTTRYLPKKAWDKLTPTQKKQANKTKIQCSKRGKQYAKNPKAAAAAAKKVRSRSKKS